MTDIEILEIDLQDLKNAIENIENALNNISDIEGLDDEYKELERILETFDNKRISLELDLEKLQENAEDDVWEDDRQERESEYWSTQFFPYELR